MKIIIVICLALASISASANEWTTGDTWRESSWQAINFIDWKQTQDLSHKCHHRTDPTVYDEENPILGKCPTLGKVDKYFAAAAAIHWVAATWLPADFRRPLQYITIGWSVGSVTNNFSIGLKISI